MITTYDFDQGTDEWLEMREGKLTASQFDVILSSKTLKYATICKDPSDDDLAGMARAKKQAEVLEQLKAGDVESKFLNASGLKGLTDKGIVKIYDDNSGCTLLGSSTQKHIDNMLAEKYYKHGDLEPFHTSHAMERGNRLEPIARTDFEMLNDQKVDEVGFIINSDISEDVGCSPDGLIGDDGGIEIKCPLPSTHIAYHRDGILPTKYKAQVHGCMAVTGRKWWWFYSFCPGFKEFKLLVERDAYTENLRRCLKEFDGIYQEQKTEIKKLITD